MMTEAAANEPRLEEYTQSLREDSFVMLLRCVGGAGLALLCVSLIAIESLEMFLPVGIVLLATYWIANLLRIRGAYRWAVGLFLTGALLAIAATLFFLPLSRNSFIFFTPLVVIIGGVLLRPRAGFVVATGAILMLAGTALALGDEVHVVRPPFLASGLLAYLSAAVAMLSAQSFFAAVEWAIDSYHRVERREAQLFESEKQLQRALSEQDFLNSRLQASNRQLDHARAVAEYANRMKSQFVANMSHELR
ncbi:MAG TPA: hypothetical protein VF897_25965, partial [Roseiflexaceae bacterium]